MRLFEDSIFPMKNTFDSHNCPAGMSNQGLARLGDKIKVRLDISFDVRVIFK